MIWRYFCQALIRWIARCGQLRQLFRLMPAEHVPLCASASPVDAMLYRGLSYQPRLYTLERAGLLRGAAAADPDDPRLVIDPLIAYLHIAKTRQPPR